MKTKLILCFVVILTWSHLAHGAPRIIHHDLSVRLHLGENRLTGADNLTIEVDSEKVLVFSLSKRSVIQGVEVEGKNISYGFQSGRLQVPLGNSVKSGNLSVLIRYEARFSDSIPVAPVNTDNPGYGVSGTISPDGCFLQAGAGWYPDIPGSLARFRLRVDAPEGFFAVTAGKNLGHITKNGKASSNWEVDHPIDGLSLSAGSYVIKKKDSGSTVIWTYLFPETAHLADNYLDASKKYLELYEKLFGPYPFAKFAVVENFFPTGYGFPSYTLLGSSVIRLPFIIHTSLGHEIAHCWWGNGVTVDYKGGNWCEALTSYVSDYYYKERASQDQAAEYRREILRKYATLAPPQKDFPLRRFQSRYDPATQAVGYGKGAMVFHMVRQRIGEKAFWDALRDVYRAKLFQPTTWEDFQRAFERHGNCSLQIFFDQWLKRKGAPKISLQHIPLQRNGKVWEVMGEIVQEKPYYDLEMELALQAGEAHVFRKVLVSGERTAFKMTCNGPPKRLTVDPNTHLFRALYPSEVPPSVNALKASSSLLFVLSTEAEGSGWEFAARTLARSFGSDQIRIINEYALEERDILQNDLVFMGLPEREALLKISAEGINLKNDMFTLKDNRYNHPSDVFFGVFPHPFKERGILGLFLPLSKETMGSAARKITHYGKYSYLVFHGGRNVEKGSWPVRESPLIHNF